MIDTKSVLASKTVWGAFAAFIAICISTALHLDPQTAALVSSNAAQVVDVGVGILGVAGSILALYGRITAKTTITVVKRP